MRKQGLCTINIDKEGIGTFIQYCKNKKHNGVTCDCIKEGLKSPNPKTKKRTNFAANFGHPECEKGK